MVASDFLAGGVNYDSPSAIFHSGLVAAGWYATVGLTTTDGHEGEALTWDDPYLDPTTSWVVMPDEQGPLDLSTVEPAFRLEEDADWGCDNLLAADLDGDGFDEMLRWHGPTRLLFTAPYTTTRTLADVDQEWPYLMDGTFLDGSIGAFADLDGGGGAAVVPRSARRAGDNVSGVASVARSTSPVTGPATSQARAGSPLCSVQDWKSTRSARPSPFQSPGSPTSTGLIPFASGGSCVEWSRVGNSSTSRPPLGGVSIR